MIATAALAAGAALVGIGLLVEIPGILMVIGLGLLLGAVALALLRRKVWRLIGVRARLRVGLARDRAGGRGSMTSSTASSRSLVVGLLVAAYLLGR